MNGPDLARIPEWYHGYISLVKETDLLKALREQGAVFSELLAGIPPEQWDHRYAKGKWTVRQVVQHCIDAERIFAYRALRFARKDQTPLAGFDENLYAEYARVENRSVDELRHEFDAVRQSTISLFKSFGDEELESEGVANEKPVYTAGIGYIIVGHTLHHERVIRERYL